MFEENQTTQNSEKRKLPQGQVEEIFNDFEARSNLVGLYDLLIKIARRNPKLWTEINK